MGVFAITGNLASGKSTVVKQLKKKGANIFDVDGRIHRGYKERKSPFYKRVVSSFPPAAGRGVISRRKLAKLVFSDAKQLHKLEGIVHPLIIKDLKKWARQSQKRRGIFVAEVPLLFEKNLEGIFDKTILIYVKRSILIERIRGKFLLSKSQAEKRLSLYLPLREKIRRADFIINNNSDIGSLKRKVDILWKELVSPEKL